jgi:hypothetical protein
MHWSLMIFSMLYLGPVAADSGEKVLAGFDPKVDVISEQYLAGAYLIYDCKHGHWTCVLENQYQECVELRKEDIQQGKPNLRCAPLGQFPTKKSCFQHQLFFVSQAHGDRFCIGEQWKQKEINF